MERRTERNRSIFSLGCVVFALCCAMCWWAVVALALPPTLSRAPKPQRSHLIISGRVVDCDGSPIANVSIKAEGTYPKKKGRKFVTTIWKRKTVSGDNGDYAVKVPYDWSGHLYTSHPDYDLYDARTIDPCEVLKR